MLESIITDPRALARYRQAPYAESREKYLEHCANQGYPKSSLRKIAWVLLGVSYNLNLGRLKKITPQAIEYAVDNRVYLYEIKNHPAKSNSSHELFIHVTTEWLRFLGCLEVPGCKTSYFTKYVNHFTTFMRDERGLSEATIIFRQQQVTNFLETIKHPKHSLKAITIHDVDAYISCQSANGWSRRSLRTLVDALRNFFRYAESRKWAKNISVNIKGPRLYAQETLPLGPTWDEVERLIASFSRNNVIDIRNRAIVLLLAVYGLRSGEVTRLCLDDIDWVSEIIHVTRPKQRCTQPYPLIQEVGDALVRYLKEARPKSIHRQLFLTINAPIRPLSSASITPIVHSRLDTLGIQLPRRGAHCLRHACARHLLDKGFSFKQIGDQLGHRSSEATREYVKVDIASLRQVAEIDLEKLS